MHFSPLKGLKRNKEGGGVGGEQGNPQKKWSELSASTDESSQCPCYKHESFPFFFRELDFTYFSGIFSSQTKTHERLVANE